MTEADCNDSFNIERILKRNRLKFAALDKLDMNALGEGLEPTDHARFEVADQLDAFLAAATVTGTPGTRSSRASRPRSDGRTPRAPRSSREARSGRRGRAMGRYRQRGRSRNAPLTRPSVDRARASYSSV